MRSPTRSSASPTNSAASSAGIGVLYGPDPFTGLAPSRAAEIHRLRYVIFNLQLRLRQGYAEHAGHDEELARLLAEAAGPLRACASALARLENQAEVMTTPLSTKFVFSDTWGAWKPFAGAPGTSILQTRTEQSHVIVF